MTRVLDVHGLVAGYDDLAVVHGVDLRVDAGEVVVLLGANGAGKSTTLLTIAGELPLLGGEIELFGEPASGRLDARTRAGLAYLPEGGSVLRSLTVAENLRLGRGRHLSEELAPELASLAGRRGGLLSGGEQRLLGLARALAAEPSLLVADEFSLGLAPTVVTRLLGAVRVAADQGAGVLLVEQHAAQALAMADRAYVLRRGEVAIEGTARELRDHLDRVGDSYLTVD